MEGEKSELSMTEDIMLSDETGDGVNSGLEIISGVSSGIEIISGLANESARAKLSFKACSLSNCLTSSIVLVYVIKFISDLRQVGGVLVSTTNKTDRHNITEILLKMALNTIAHPTLILIFMTFILKLFFRIDEWMVWF
jgi:hypothetical protein